MYEEKSIIDTFNDLSTGKSGSVLASFNSANVIMCTSKHYYEECGVNDAVKIRIKELADKIEEALLSD